MAATPGGAAIRSDGQPERVVTPHGGRSSTRSGRRTLACRVCARSGPSGCAMACRSRAARVRRGCRVKATQRDDAAPCPLDCDKRQVRAERPNAWWIAGFPDCWTGAGFAYGAIVTDVFARRIVGWRVSASMRTDVVLDALHQGVNERQAPGSCTAIMVRRSRPPLGRQCSTGWASSRRTGGPVLATTTPTPRRSSEARSTGRRFRPQASRT